MNVQNDSNLYLENMELQWKAKKEAGILVSADLKAKHDHLR